MKETQESTQLIKLNQPGFEYLIWRSLLDAPSLLKTIADIRRVLELPVDNWHAADQLALLIKYFQQHCCLVVLDDFEAVLEDGSVNTYRPGYEGYGKLLKQMVETVHQSYLVVTKNCATNKRLGNTVELNELVKPVGNMVQAKPTAAMAIS